MTDTFYIGAYWKNRKEVLENIVIPTLNTLTELRGIDDQFLNLYELGMSRKQALEREFIPSSEYIERLYRHGLKKKDLDQDGYSKIGFSLWLWSGHKDEESSQVSFGVGKGSERLTNVCLIRIPTEGIAKERLLQLDKVKQIIEVLIKNWNPDKVILNSKELSTALNSTNEIGWVTYIKRTKGISKANGKIVHEPNYYGGDLFYLKTNSGLTYDYSLIDEYQSFKKQIS